MNRSAPKETGTMQPQRVTYRVSEVAHMFGVCERTVWAWIDKRKIASVKILGVRLVRADSINALLANAAE